jgi:signal transduction histidine kinase
MLLAPRGTRDGWTRADQRLLREFAHQAALTVYAIGLTDQLQPVNMDLQRSREGLVVAREEERRRLRRDLHDGLAPTLAALALTTSTLSEIIPREPELAIEITHELEQAMRSTIGDIRRLVYDLRPPTLDELGLVAAIREYIAQQTGFSNRSGWKQTETTQLQVTLESNEALPALPAAVEVAAYRIVQEALMNVVRHAQAISCRITITLEDMLQIAVCDDGIGLPAEHRTGVGLLSMRERAEELGGTCTIERSERGTCVHAQLPIARKGNE